MLGIQCHFPKKQRSEQLTDKRACHPGWSKTLLPPPLLAVGRMLIVPMLAIPQPTGAAALQTTSAASRIHHLAE